MAVNNPIKVYLHLRFRMNVRQSTKMISHPKTTFSNGDSTITIPVMFNRQKNNNQILSFFIEKLLIIIAV